MSISMVYGDFSWYFSTVDYLHTDLCLEKKQDCNTLPLRFPSDNWIPRCKTPKLPDIKNHPLTALQALQPVQQDSKAQ